MYMYIAITKYFLKLDYFNRKIPIYVYILDIYIYKLILKVNKFRLSKMRYNTKHIAESIDLWIK